IMSTPPKQVASVGKSVTPSTGGGSAASADGKNNNNNNNNNNNENKFKQFEGEGVIFKAKLVGTELVMEPRGDKMCQNSIK
ncbi:MAG: hypothetical protein N7Q72_04060, partial [Spiroplasma sp. Tabriz.8]|nr:hypothetical protein [Candidatus Regiella insecticola]MCZ8632420.1 hypothetical protein [Spiroplasma sp. Tabriz.8]